MGVWESPWKIICSERVFVGFAATIGAGMMWVYIKLVQDKRFQMWGQRSFALIPLAFLISPAVILTLYFFPWPVLERVLPAVAYRYGPIEVRNRIEERAIRSIKVGDRLEDLREKLPLTFKREGWYSGSHGNHFDYKVFIENGKVVSIEVKGLE